MTNYPPGKHPNSLANLRPYRKGDGRGNRSGVNGATKQADRSRDARRLALAMADAFETALEVEQRRAFAERLAELWLEVAATDSLAMRHLIEILCPQLEAR